jgi:tRNA(Ile)-lysidine synthase
LVRRDLACEALLLYAATMAITLPAADLVARFERDLAAVAPDGGPFALAVSGGPDSLALLLLAAAAEPEAVHAATVDHGLRCEGAAEAAMVAAMCAALDARHQTLRVAVTPGGEGLQAAARKARYAALAQWMDRNGLATLLTAHHADDQAETLLMRLQRGSGVAGLAGVRRRSPVPGSGGRLVVARPLLGWRRSELAAIVATAGVEPVADASNTDLQFDRTRVRQQIAATPWLDVAALARSAAALADADAALDAATARLFEERAQVSGGRLDLDADRLPVELQRRLVLCCLRALAPAAAPRGDQLTALVADLAAGKTSTLAGVKCIGGGVWRFEPAPPRR